DSPFVYASAKQGFATLDPEVRTDDMTALLDTIIDYVPAPEGEENAPFKLLISTTDYNDYVGRIGIGKIEAGTINLNDQAYIVNYNNPDVKKRINITKIFEFEGLNRVEVPSSKVGSIVAVSGVEGINIGDTLCSPDDIEALPFVKISEPTLSMTFLVNNSPMAGMDGKYVTSRQIRDRLYKELETDVSLRVEDGDTTDSFKISGRGELHLSVLIENMRREGYEFQVSKPEVLFKKNDDGKKMEPIEIATID